MILIRDATHVVRGGTSLETVMIQSMDTKDLPGKIIISFFIKYGHFPIHLWSLQVGKI